MNNSKELALDLEKALENIQNHFNASKSDVSRLDLLREDILHHMESSTFDASQGYKYAKALQLVSQQRRLAKSELASIQVLHSKIKDLKSTVSDATSSVVAEYEKREAIRQKGHEAYRPRILKSIDKDDVLNQVVEMLQAD